MSRRQADARLGWLSKAGGSWHLVGSGSSLVARLASAITFALKYKAQATEAQERAREGLMYGHYLSTIVIHAPDESTRDAVAERVKNAIEQVEGFAVRVEDENAMEAFIASLPGERDASEYREARVSVRNAAHFFPLTATWAGPSTHEQRFGKGAPPLLWTTTNGATPFRLLLHVGELGHALVVGKSGGGKSALLMRLVSAHLARYQRARAWMFDVGYSAYKYCLGAGGFHYVIGEEGGPSLSPLSGLNDPARRRAILKWLRNDVFELRARLSDEQAKELSDALRDLGSIREDARLSDLSVRCRTGRYAESLRSTRAHSWTVGQTSSTSARSKSAVTRRSTASSTERSASTTTS